MNKSVRILMVDDDELDVEIVRRSFCKMDLSNQVVSAPNGVEALKVLRGEDGHQALAMPYLILLDLNMPHMDGLEFLGRVRKDPQLKHSVVFVLTSSQDPAHMNDAYQAHVSGYIFKDWLHNETDELINLIRKFQELNEFPHS